MTKSAPVTGIRDRCVTPPVVTELREIGLFRLFGG